MLTKIIKKDYILVPLITLAVAILGSWFTGLGMNWYSASAIPEYTPSGSFIGIVWTIIFVLTAVSAITFFNLEEKHRDPYLFEVTLLFIANAIINVFWSYLFFTLHLPMAAFFALVLLELTVVMLVYFIWKKSKFAGVLLLPYFIWLVIAGYFNLMFWFLNS